MLKIERMKYETLLRVKDFGIAHRERFPEGSIGGQAFAQVADAAGEIEALAQAKPLAAGTGQKEKALAREAVKAAMQEIARTARGIELAPGTRNTLLMPRRGSDVVVLGAARTFIREAEAVREELGRLGLPDTCITALRAAVDVFESTMRGRRAGRTGVAAAAGGMKAAFGRASKALAKLDIVVPNAVKGDAALLAAWKRCREVVGGHSSRTAADRPEAPAAEPVAAPAGDPPGEVLRKAS